MSQAALETIQELFSDLEQFTPENMEKLIGETLKFFEQLKDKLESKDENERDEALRMAVALKDRLEEQAMSLCKSAGMEPAALEAYINNPSHFSKEEWEAIEKAKTELKNYQSDIGKSEEPVVAKRKKPKAIKEWLVT